ncbi:hypothetical protein Tco_0815567 [Tanacetum coccineum]
MYVDLPGQRLMMYPNLPLVKESKQLLSLTQTHISQPSGSGAHEGTGVKPGVPDVPTYRSDDEEEIPWKSSDEDDNDDNEDDDDDQGVPDDDQGDDNDSKRTVSDTEGDDFVHPKFTSHDTKERHDEEDKDEESFDPRVQTPSHYEPLNDEANDDLPQSGYVEEEEQSSSVSSGFISNMLNPNPDTSIESILNVETTSLVDVLVTSQAITTLPQPSNPLIPPVQQTPTPTLATTPSSKLKESVDFAVQLKSDRLREEAQTKNESFLNNLDATMQTIIKEQVNARVKKEVSKILPRMEKLVNEQLESEVRIRSLHEAKSTQAVTANLRQRSPGCLWRYDEADDDQEPSAGMDRGSKRRHAGKEPESSSAPKETTSKSTGKSTEGSKSHHQSALAKEPIYTEDDFEEPTHQEFETGVNDDQPEDEIHPSPDWFQKPTMLGSLKVSIM